jgi:hypothetical protein
LFDFYFIYWCCIIYIYILSTFDLLRYSFAVTIYVLTIVSFVFFQERYSSAANSASVSVNCDTLASCFFTNIHYGMIDVTVPLHVWLNDENCIVIIIFNYEKKLYFVFAFTLFLNFRCCVERSDLPICWWLRAGEPRAASMRQHDVRMQFQLFVSSVVCLFLLRFHFSFPFFLCYVLHSLFDLINPHAIG